MIELREVGVTVPGATAGVPPRALLTDVTLTLGERRIAVIGANGSGKSTLLRLLNGLVLPTRGYVRVDGLDTATHGSAVRRAVGFVFTDPLAQLVMPTPLEDVELSLRRTVRREARRARAVELLAAYGLGHLQHSSVYDLSGGERQLVALVSVLAVEPSVVVADEPTTLLDLRNRNRIREELSRLEQQVVLATHDLELAQDADRVLVVEGGRIVADGRPEDAIAAYVELVRP
ncbi:MAG: ABC transporter ATP-binding protein [Actinobacteria bacterium]|nr:ABC transporter ATP-binding protein [Actinomycetota bacterium]